MKNLFNIILPWFSSQRKWTGIAIMIVLCILHFFIAFVFAILLCGIQVISIIPI